MGNQMGVAVKRFQRAAKVAEALQTAKYENASLNDIPRLLNLANDTYYVRFTGKAMVPTLPDGETLLEVRRRKSISGLFSGDVVALRRPNDIEKVLVRRITASAGDELVSSGKLPPLSVPDRNYWVECDNEKNQEDSREFGMVSEDNMIGRVVAVVNPGYSVTGFVVNSEEAMREDADAFLLTAEQMRSMLENWQQVKPYVKKLDSKWDDEDGEDGKKSRK